MNINKYSLKFGISILLNIQNKVDGICREDYKEGKQEANEGRAYLIQKPRVQDITDTMTKLLI